jgi:oligopeptidase B
MNCMNHTEMWGLAHPLFLQCPCQVVEHTERVIGYDASLYCSALEWVPSADGTLVPLSLAWREDRVKKDGSNPALLQAYGAYGSRQWPSFDPADVSLMDRGVVLAVAHVRGGGEMGARWHVEVGGFAGWRS